MIRAFSLALLLLFYFAGMANAQNAPPLEACRAFAKKELAREGMKAADVILERDAGLAVEPYGRKVGSQLVRLVVSGNGAIVLPDSPSAELQFICLLADAKQPLFFNWLPRPNVAPLAQCSRAEAMKAKARPCLEVLLQAAEMDLTSVYALRFQEAHERGDAALAAYRASNEEWREYRDAECARRANAVPADAAPEDHSLACRVELTRRRALDMR